MVCRKDLLFEFRGILKTAIYLFKKGVGREPSYEELWIIVDNVIKEMVETEEK